MKFMPGYMAAVSFFWQLYISSVASNSTNHEQVKNDSKIEKIDNDIEVIFKAIDIDGSGVIDSTEIIKVFASKGRKLSKEELQHIMKSIDKDNNGEISLDEFKLAFNSGVMIETKLWNLIKDDMKFQKGGAIAAIQRLKDYKSKVNSETNNVIDNNEIIQNQKRQNAIKAASIGGSCLVISALFRKLILKI